MAAPGPSLLVLALLGGCASAEDYTADADREVGQILDEVQDLALSGRKEWVQYPLPAPDPPAPAEQAAPDEATVVDDADAMAIEPAADLAPDTPETPATSDATDAAETAPEQLPAAGAAEPAAMDDRAALASLPEPGPDALRLDLRESLRTAVSSGRDYLTQKESVFQQGLSLSLVRYNFGPLLDGTISYLWSDAEDSQDVNELAIAGSATQILPSGGVFGLTALLGGTHTGTGVPAVFASGLGASLAQPLLRGAGYEVSHAALTQAERDMVYAVRDFELFREDFSIGIAADYFDLVSQRARLANLEQNFRDALFDRNKSVALRQVDRNRDEDVFLARRRLIDAESDLLAARTDHEAALDAFKIRLGLPSSAEVAIADEEPPFLPVRLDEDSAVTVALHNRLDLITAAERVEDVERDSRIARNGLLPDLTLDAAWGTAGANDNFAGGAVPDDWSASAGLTLSLPLQRQAERNAWRNSLIALDQARRDETLQRDDVERDIVNQLRELRQVEQQIELQRQQITQEQRAVAVTEIRYEAGDVENRDLLDARQSLVDAQNALIDLLARHFIARLRLLRNLGVLFIDEHGMWPT